MSSPIARVLIVDELNDRDRQARSTRRPRALHLSLRNPRSLFQARSRSPKFAMPASAPSPIGEIEDEVEAANNKEVIAKAENFQRSAAAPVGMVAPVSMNSIWNRKSTVTPTS